MIADLLFAPFARWAATTIDGVHPGDPTLRKIFGGGPQAVSGAVVDEDTAMGYPAYWRAVNIVCNGVAKIPFQVLKYAGDSKKERDREHPAHRIVRRRVTTLDSGMPMSAGHFRRTLQAHALNWGNGYAHIDRDDSSRPAELSVLLPDRTRLAIVKGGGKIPMDMDGRLVYQTVIGGEHRFFLPESILHIHGLGWDGTSGYPLVELLKESLGMGLAAREFGSRFFGQGATSSGVVTIPEGLDEEAEERFIQSLKSAHQGLGKSHKFIVLEEGSAFTPMTVPPEAAQFLQTREFERSEVALIVGVQPYLLGDKGNTSYASLEQASQNHLDQDLDPWLSIWEEEYEEKLLTEDEKQNETHCIQANRKALLRTDMAGRYAAYATARGWGWMSANDVLAKEDEDDIGSQGDQYLVPTNMRPADQEFVETPAAPFGVVPPDDESEEPTEDDRAARDSQRELFADTLGRIGRRLGQEARKHAKDPAVYCEWLEHGVSPYRNAIEAMVAAPRASVLATTGIDAMPHISHFVWAIWIEFNAACDHETATALPSAVETICQRYEKIEPAEWARRVLP